MSDLLIVRGDDYETRLTKTQKAACLLMRKGEKVTMLGIKRLTGGDMKDIKGRIERLIDLGFLRDLNEKSSERYQHMHIDVLKDADGKWFDVTRRKRKAKFDPSNGRAKRGSIPVTGF